MFGLTGVSDAVVYGRSRVNRGFMVDYRIHFITGRNIVVSSEKEPIIGVNGVAKFKSADGTPAWVNVQHVLSIEEQLLHVVDHDSDEQNKGGK